MRPTRERARRGISWAIEECASAISVRLRARRELAVSLSTEKIRQKAHKGVDRAASDRREENRSHCLADTLKPTRSRINVSERSPVFWITRSPRRKTASHLS